MKLQLPLTGQHDIAADDSTPLSAGNKLHKQTPFIIGTKKGVYFTSFGCKINIVESGIYVLHTRMSGAIMNYELWIMNYKL